MENFSFQNTTQIVFGAGTHREVGELLQGRAKKILLLYGNGSIKRTGLYDGICASLKAAGVPFVEVGGIRPNPDVALIRRAVAVCREEQVDCLLAVGGGSVIDSAKTIAVSTFLNGDAWELYSAGKEADRALPLAAVLTLPATGTEFNGDAVLSNEETNQKLCFSSDLIRPVFSIIDPTLFYSLPDNQIANGVCDIMSHVLERYLSTTPHTELIDSLCEATLRTVLHNAPKLLENREDYDAWSQVSLAGAVANNGLLGVGREQDWACHDMEHEISAVHPEVFHGAGLAVVTPAWMRYVYREQPEVFARFARNVMGCTQAAPLEAAEEGIRRLERFFRAMKLPATMGELGVGSGEWEGMAKRVVAEGQTIGAVKQLGWQDVLAIYRLAGGEEGTA